MSFIGVRVSGGRASAFERHADKAALDRKMGMRPGINTKRVIPPMSIAFHVS